MAPVDVQSASTADAQITPRLNTVGIEFEYPVAPGDSWESATRESAETSNALRSEYGSCNDWHLGLGGVPVGYMGSDHTGAEITSAELDIHSNQPEDWYIATIEEATDRGYPHAANGNGQTCFGMHLHLSELDYDDARFLHEISNEDWARVMFCASVTEDSLDPWRHGGVNMGGDFGESGLGHGGILREAQGVDHWEWRLPEPGLPEHVHCILEFVRLLATQGQSAARDYAEELVYTKDERLTPVRQFQYLREEVDGWPHGNAFDSNSETRFGVTDEPAAQTFFDIMND